ncbi:origin recognition complex subunit 3 [Phlebotomus argentipes]|uniref:origin recognition complex subunit 3 n=1 Tax=Phlebotomus argentipes TaxID=94469 RepID=UPI0028936124|nr:origin recognition complex subunit 3 [Phlebotomus argentipes]
MEPDVSVSKGCFVYKNASVRPPRKSGGKKRPSIATQDSILPQDILASPWYRAYQETWQRIHSKIENILRENYSRVMESVLECVVGTSSSAYSYLFPVIVLQTGINQPDHLSMFQRLSDKISDQDKLCSVVLTSTEATSVKVAIETLVGGFIQQFQEAEIRKQNCTMRSLCGAFLEHRGIKTTLAVVIPDFELFCKATLRDLVTILASYRSQLPLVLLFGVATSVSALEQLLPLKFTTRAKFHVFQTQSSVVILNNIVESVILREKIHLSGRVLQFLVEKFLFYDFSVSGFVQGLKFCLLEHFSQGKIYSLATSVDVQTILQKHEDCENIRRLPSVRRHVEMLPDCREIIALLTNDTHLGIKLETSWMPAIEEFFLHFHSALHFLYELVRELPKSPLGKQLREIYCFATVNSLSSSQEYVECRQLLMLMSKEAFFVKLSDCVDKVEDFLEQQCFSQNVQAIQKWMHNILEQCRVILREDVVGKAQEKPDSALLSVNNRFELKKMLLEKAKEQNQMSGQAGLLSECLRIVEEQILGSWLIPFTRGPPLIELFVHSDASSTRRHLIGSPRGALHQALTNPQHYFQCGCCDGNSLNCHLPDLTIAYRLHCECGRMINLFDWLQAFQSIVQDPQDDAVGEERGVSAQVQARFTRAVGELEFLGYVRSSKRKVDHVEKLTW